MITRYKLALTVGFVLAISITLSCSGDDGGGTPDTGISSSGDGGGSSSSDGGCSSGGSSSSDGLSSSDVSSSSGNADSSPSVSTECTSWSEWAITPATCDAEGSKTRSCTSGITKTETEEIPQLEWSDWSVTTPATCVATGVKTATCPNDDSQTQSIAKLPYDNTTHLCDARDGKLYKFVTIGTGATAQTWMAENLNYEAEGSKCGSVLIGNGILVDANTQVCDTYGRLYNWSTAMGGSTSSTANPSGIQGICPSGWHLPSDAEWGALMQLVNPSCSPTGNCTGAGEKLKADSPLWNSAPSWMGNFKGTDDFGFSALPGGLGDSDGDFEGVGDYGYWWSATENNTTSVYYWAILYRSADGIRSTYYKTSLYSVRCVQD